MNTTISFGLELLSAPLTDEHRESLLADNWRFLELIRDRFQTAWVEDHFQYETAEQLEGWTYMAYLMPSFPELQFGTLVLGQSYRNPALLAKMAVTLQRLSGGRLILGIGAGWKSDEYQAYGWDFPSPGRRVAELGECARILKAMWTQTPATFEGRYYSINDAYCEPKPLPMIPLMIGGKGERGTLRVVARYADWWNCSLLSPDGFRHKLDVLKRHCAEVGRDFNEITQTVFSFVSIATEPTKVQRSERVHYIAGSPDDVTRELEQFVTLGAQHFMLRFLDFPSTAGLELFLDRVLPRVR